MNYRFVGTLALCLLALAFGARIHKKKSELVSGSPPVTVAPLTDAQAHEADAAQAVAEVNAEADAAAVSSENETAKCDALFSATELVECARPLQGIDPTDIDVLLNPLRICPVLTTYVACVPAALVGCSGKHTEKLMAPTRKINDTLKVLGCRSDVPKSTCSASVTGSVNRACAKRWFKSCRSSKVQCKCGSKYRLGGEDPACDPTDADKGRKFDSDKLLGKNCSCVPESPETVAEALAVADTAVASVNGMSSCNTTKVRDCSGPVQALKPSAWANPQEVCPLLTRYVACVPEALSECPEIVKAGLSRPLKLMEKVVKSLFCPAVPKVACEASVSGSVRRKCSKRFIFKSCRRSNTVKCKCETGFKLGGSDPACDSTAVLLGRKFDSNKLSGKGCSCVPDVPEVAPEAPAPQRIVDDARPLADTVSAPATAARKTEKVEKSTAFSAPASYSLLLAVALCLCTSSA